jgi:hypothetical protein
MSPWVIPFLYVSSVENMYNLYEALLSGETLKGWWNGQGMWIIKRITSYLYGVIDTIRNLVGLSKMGFAVTSKVSNKDESNRYEQEIMEFGSSSPECDHCNSCITQPCVPGGRAMSNHHRHLAYGIEYIFPPGHSMWGASYHQYPNL